MSGIFFIPLLPYFPISDFDFPLRFSAETPETYLLPSITKTGFGLGVSKEELLFKYETLTWNLREPFAS